MSDKVAKLFLSPDGRIGRQDFWLGWLALFAAVTLTGWIPLVGGLVFVVAVYCHVCVYAKRLHDMGRSGWLQIWTYVPYIIAFGISVFAVVTLIGAGVTWQDLPQIGLLAGGIGAVMIAVLSWIAAIAVDIGFLIWLGVAEGQPYANAYGPEPGKDFSDALPIV